MIDELVNGILEVLEPFVVPDWGALVALIPVGLAGLVFVYVTWTLYRFATAGPTRRGRRRLPPATPPGVHLPGPSFAPLLAATGLFFMVFGTVAGGIWLGVGAVILVITLLYWGREELHNYDRLPAAGAAGSPGFAAGALPAPQGSPPAGVHMPPPSFRPLLVAISLTLVVAGMVVGGWALLLGFIALVLTLLGWLRDARHEYAATETADTTGHLDLGGAPGWPVPVFASLAVLVALGLLLSSGLIGGPSGGAPGASGGAASGGGAPAGGGGAPASASPTLPAADVVITAAGINWVTPNVTVAAARPFKLAFDNQDPKTLHDIVVRDAAGATVWKSELVTGPAIVVYDVPAIAPGQYPFVCSVHPNMQGTLTAE